MKFWAKALIWFGLGGGIGFFAGYGLGTRYKARGGPSESPDDEEYIEEPEELSEAAETAFAAYRGDADGDKDLPDGWENDPLTLDELEGLLKKVESIETVPADIHQLHPQDMEPRPISKEEFNDEFDYEPDYERKLLSYYEGDEVLYDEERAEIIEVPDEVLGIGALLGFGGDPNNPAESIYIQNDTMGTLYEVDLVHAAFYGEVETPESPDEVDWGDGDEEEL